MIRTKKQFEKFYRAEVLPLVRKCYEQDGQIDYPARREEWNNAVDAMLANGELPRKAGEWVCPW